MKVSVLGGEENTPLNLDKTISNLVLSWNCAKIEVSCLPRPTLRAVHSKAKQLSLLQNSPGRIFQSVPKTIHQLDLSSLYRFILALIMGFIFSYSPQARTEKLQVSRHSFSTRYGLETWVVHLWARDPI